MREVHLYAWGYNLKTFGNRCSNIIFIIDYLHYYSIIDTLYINILKILTNWLVEAILCDAVDAASSSRKADTSQAVS